MRKKLLDKMLFRLKSHGVVSDAFVKQYHAPTTILQVGGTQMTSLFMRRKDSAVFSDPDPDTTVVLRFGKKHQTTPLINHIEIVCPNPLLEGVTLTVLPLKRPSEAQLNSSHAIILGGDENPNIEPVVNHLIRKPTTIVGLAGESTRRFKQVLPTSFCPTAWDTDTMADFIGRVHEKQENAYLKSLMENLKGEIQEIVTSIAAKRIKSFYENGLPLHIAEVSKEVSGIQGSVVKNFASAVSSVQEGLVSRVDLLVLRPFKRRKEQKVKYFEIEKRYLNELNFLLKMYEYMFIWKLAPRVKGIRCKIDAEFKELLIDLRSICQEFNDLKWSENHDFTHSSKPRTPGPAPTLNSVYPAMLELSAKLGAIGYVTEFASKSADAGGITSDGGFTAGGITSDGGFTAGGITSDGGFTAGGITSGGASPQAGSPLVLSRLVLSPPAVIYSPLAEWVP